MRVKREVLRGLLTALGYPADKFDDKRMLMKARTLKEVDDIDVRSKDLSGPDREVLTDVLATTRKGKKVVFEDGDPVAESSSNGEVQTQRKGSKVKTKNATRGKGASKNGAAKGKKGSPAGTDAFGTRLGTKFAKANAVLGKKPLTMSEVVAKAGLDATCYNHLNKLVEKGLVKKSDEGYAVAAGK